MGLRSPGKTSPIRGRTMKEYEEQLSQLRKENFNLKLRIYFLEERMGRMNGPDDKEDAVKKNIELKVEAESLRKEVSDKQGLLCQASKAMDLMEEQHQKELKKIEQEKDLEKGILESRIQELETALKEHENKLKDPHYYKLEDSASFITDAFGLRTTNTCIDHHTREEVETLQQHIEELEAQVQQLECTLQEEEIRSNQLEADLQEAQQEVERVGVRCQGLEFELKQRDNKLEDLVQELEHRGQDLAGCNLRIRTLEEALSAKEPEIQIKVQELCERDRIIEEKQSQIEQQNKVLVEIQITLDEKQRQIEALRSSLVARDSSIADLEGRLAKAKTNARNLEAKLDASVHEANRLREELETFKAQQKRANNRSREHLQQGLDLLSPLRRRSSNLSSASDGKTSPRRWGHRSSEEDGTVRNRLLELREREEKLIVEESQQVLRKQHERVRQEANSLKEKVKELESCWQNAECKLQETEKKMKDVEGKLKKVEEDYLKACQAIKSFMKRTKDMGREIEQLRSDVKKKDSRICDLVSEVNELQDACNKANWEAHQLQAQARVQGGCGMPGAFEDVRDMTEEENERLWAEVEDKNKKLAHVTKERDNLSTEMEKQVQALITNLSQKEMLLEDYEKKTATSVNELEARDNRIKELEEDLNRLMKSDGEEQLKEVSNIKENQISSVSEGLVIQLEDNNQEVERLDEELQKRASSLQELINKELWDKNREIEKLQDQLNSISVRRELEIMSLQQQIGSRDFQLKMLQDKVAELGVQVNLPTSLMLRELKQIPVTFNQHVHYQQLSVSSGDTLRTDTGDIPTAELGTSAMPSTISASKDEVTCLRDQLQASVEERTYLCRKVEELRERLRNTPERDNDSRTLRSECARLREEIDRANVWRKEAGEVCSLLTKRLEEVAGFLSSLLSHPEQLGGLRTKHRQLLKQVIERSMELSRSLSVSLSINDQDLTNGSFPPLMDSFSSLLMSAGDVNMSLIDVLKDDIEEGEVSSYDTAQQEVIKSSRMSPYESALTTTSQCCRSSGSNNEIAQIHMMKDSSTSEDNNALRDKIVGEQAKVIAQLRSQVETLTHEIKQRDIEFSRSQKELNMYNKAEAATMSGPRSEHCSSSKHSSSSSGVMWMPRTETERLVDIEETKESLSSMTFYNSQHPSSSTGKQWSNEPQTLLSNVENSVLGEANILIEAVSGSCQERNTEVARSVSLPIKITNVIEEVGQQDVALNLRKSVLKKQDSKNTNLPINKICRSSSASAVAFSHLQQPIHQHDVAGGSLSDSEAWSEPDRNVSLARIGLNEESAKAVQSPGTNVGGCTVISSIRPRNPRITQEDTDTSESSEETAHEINRIQGKRGRSDMGEVRRLQNRLRAQEQVNEALRAELTILHQLAPSPSFPPLTETNDKPSIRDMSMNTSKVNEEKLDKSTSVEQLQERSSGSSITIPICLLDQIRCQREKLESSLYHNDFIRCQLEGIISSLSSQGDDNMMSLWQKVKETVEQLEEARRLNKELEAKLEEVRVQLEESKQKARLANVANEQLQVTRQTVTILQEQVSNLESRLQEKDNEILERKCLMLEVENQTQQQSIEIEKMMQEAVQLKEEAERKIQTAESIKLEADIKLLEAQKLMTEAEKTKLEAEGQIAEIEKQSEVAKLQIKEAEIQTGLLQTEKESILRERGVIQKDREMVQREKEVTEEKEKALEREKEIMQKEIEESMEKIESLAHDAKKQREEAEMQIKAAKKKIQDAEILKQDAERKLKASEEMGILLEKHSRETLDMRTKEMEVRLIQQLHEAKKKLQEKECVSKAEMEKKILEAERRSQEIEAGLRSQIEGAQEQDREIKAEADMRIKNVEERSKKREMELMKRLQDSERHFREKEFELIKQLDEVTLSTSQAELERTRLANEKLHLEQEVRRHEAREAELIRERKDAENCLLVAKEKVENEMVILQQQKNDLEKHVKELEAAYMELKEDLCRLRMKEEPSSPSRGPFSSSSMPHIKVGRTSPGSFSSGLDQLTGEGSLPNSPWGTTATVSLEYSGSQNDDRDRSKRGSNDGSSGGLAALSSVVLQHGFHRQHSELSDYKSEDQAVEEYGAVLTQTCSSSYWFTSLTGQHSAASNSISADPSSMRNINSSPDLGIESDQGRFSSLEAASSGVQIDTSKVVSTMEGYGCNLNPNLTAVSINSRCDTAVKTYKELEQENIVLKQRLTKTHRALEETMAQLTTANQRKKQVERAICRQLHKTHHILKTARVSLKATADCVTPSAEEME